MKLAAAKGLSLIRIGFGLYFIISALRKTVGGWMTNGEPLTRFLQAQLEGSTPLYDSFLAGTVVPNAGTFAQLIVLGEWVAGVSLLLGLFTRLGAVVGMWLVLNYMLAKGLPDADGSVDRLFFLSCAVFAACAAGLVWGLDGALRPWLASNPAAGWLIGIPRPPRPIALLRDRREEEVRRRAA